MFLVHFYSHEPRIFFYSIAKTANVRKNKKFNYLNANNYGCALCMHARKKEKEGEKMKGNALISIGDKAVTAAAAAAHHHLNSFHFYSMWHVLDSEWMNAFRGWTFLFSVVVCRLVFHWNPNACEKTKVIYYSANEVTLFSYLKIIELNLISKISWDFSAILWQLFSFLSYHLSIYYFHFRKHSSFRKWLQ